ncbi:hypothetical protein GYB59_02135 [bacterium]|nr:hypothetical protein [bacterium]
MSKNIWRGDAPAVAQVSKISPNPDGGSIAISINGKTLGTWESFDAQTIADAWNNSPIPEYSEATATVSQGEVLITANTAGYPFHVVVQWANEQTTTNTVLLLKMVNSPTSGTYKLTYGGDETVAINFNATATTVLAAIAGLAVFQAADLLVEDTEDGIRIETKGDHAGYDANDFGVNYSGLRGGNASISVTQVRPYSAGVDEVQRITINNATGGTWGLETSDGTLIGASFAHNVSAATLESAFDSALGAGLVSVSEISSGVFDCTFDGGASAETNVGQLVADYDSLTPGQTNDIWQLDTTWKENFPGSGPQQTDMVDGWVYLSYPGGYVYSGETLSGVEGGNELADIMTALASVLDEFFGNGNYTISKDQGGTDGLYQIEAKGEYGGESGLPTDAVLVWQPNFEDGEVGEQPTATVSTIQTAVEGKPEKQDFAVPPATSGNIRFQFALQSGTVTTGNLAYDFAAADLETALEAIFGSGLVTVTGTRIDGLVATYDASLGDVPLPSIVLNTLVFPSVSLSMSNPQFTNDAGTDTITVDVESVVGSSVTSGAWSYEHEADPNTPENIVVTASIAWNDTPAQIASKIEGAYTLQGLTPNSVTAEYVDEPENDIWVRIVMVFTEGTTNSGADGAITVDEGTLVADGNVNVYTTQLFVEPKNEIQRIQLDHRSGGGTIVVDYDGDTVTVPGDDNSLFYLQNYLNSIDALRGNIAVRYRPRTVDSGYNSAYDIEFVNGLKQTDVPAISLTSNLEPVNDSYPGARNYEWTRTATGADAANVAVTTPTDGSPEQGEQQRITLTGDPHSGTWTATIDAEETTDIDVAADAATVESAVEALTAIGAGNVTVTETESGWLFDFAPSLGDVDDITLDHDLHNSSATLDEVTKGGVSAFSTVVESRGPNHLDDPLNWTLGRVPDKRDDVILETGTEGPQYGLRQAAGMSAKPGSNRMLAAVDFRVGQVVRVAGDDLPAGLSAETDYHVIEINRYSGWLRLSESAGGAAVELTDEGSGEQWIGAAYQSIVQHQRFGGEIGLRLRNSGEYYEYRPRYLACSLDSAGSGLVELGRGDESGSGLLRFDFVFDPVNLVVYSTGSTGEPGTPTVNVLCNDAAASVTAHDGESGVAFFEGEAALLKAVDVRGGEMSGGDVTFAANATVSYADDFPAFRKITAANGVTISQDS